MLVVHKATGFLCGMKVMSKKQIREDKYENQIARELSIQFYLSHRNVSPLYGYFTDEENIYLLVEFATQGQLLQTLRKAHRMEEADCSPIIREVC
jgi:aurora kinase, other